MKLKDIRLDHLDTKYPLVRCKKDEDLDISRNMDRILTKCWEDRTKYPTKEHIAATIGLSVRTIERMARRLGLSLINS